MIPYFIEGLTWLIPALCIFWFGWRAVPVGVFVVWFLPLIRIRYIGPTMDSTASYYYWGLIGWMVGIVYSLILLGIRVIFRLGFFGTRRMQCRLMDENVDE